MSTKKAHRLKRINLPTNCPGSFYSLPLLYSTAVHFLSAESCVF